MPDKYEFRRFADNLTHPWFKDIQSDFKQLWMSPNRLLLCILCLLLMNLDDTTIFQQFGPDSDQQQQSFNNENNNNRIIDSNEITLYKDDAYELIIENTNKYQQKQCNKIPMNNYLGSKKKNIFHTQLFIGVMFGFIMNCRLPILFTFINIIIRSGCSFKPKIIPMFIDKKNLRPHTFYGSSYRLLNKKEKVNYKFLEQDYNYYDDESSSDDDDDSCSVSNPEEVMESDQDDEDEEQQFDNDYDYDYKFVNDILPKQLFGDEFSS